MQHGAIELACLCLRTHPNSVVAQTDAASLLCNLAFTSRFTDKIVRCTLDHLKVLFIHVAHLEVRLFLRTDCPGRRCARAHRHD